MDRRTGMERKILGTSEPVCISVPIGNPVDLGDGFFSYPQKPVIRVRIVFEFTEEIPSYLGPKRDWWHVDMETGIVYVQFHDNTRKRYTQLIDKKNSGKKLNAEEINELETLQVIINALPKAAIENAISESNEVYKVLIKNQPKDETETEDKEKGSEKKEYRTKNNAGDVMDKLPANIAIITNDQYKGGLGLNQTGGAYLYPLATSDGLRYDGKTLFFQGLPTSEATLKEINKDKEVAIDNIDLPLLRMFYSIILMDFMDNSSKLGVVNETVSVYVPDLASLLGKGRNISKLDIKNIIDKTSSFQTIYGVIKDPQRPKGIGSAVPLLVWMGYDEKTNTIKFASPYMTQLIKRIYNVSIKKDAKGLPIIKKNGEALLDASHSYLIKSSIVKERNKRAVEIVIVVVTTIEQAGKYTPHLKAKTIIERIPQLQESLDKAKTNSDKNKILKRAFTKAWELLGTQTELRTKYPTIELPDPNNPKYIPTMATIDMVFQFPHKEKTSNQP